MSSARHIFALHPSMLATRRSICVATTTNNARWDYTYYDMVGSILVESQDPTNPRSLPCDEETCALRRSSSGRCPDRSPSGESHGIAIARSSTTFSCSRPKNHCTRAIQRSASTNRCPPSTRRAGPFFLSAAGHDRVPGARCRHYRFAFFPPRSYSPSFTFVFVSIEISSVSGSASASARTALTFSKIASVSFVFFSGFPF